MARAGKIRPIPEAGWPVEHDSFSAPANRTARGYGLASGCNSSGTQICMRRPLFSNIQKGNCHEIFDSIFGSIDGPGAERVRQTGRRGSCGSHGSCSCTRGCCSWTRRPDRRYRSNRIDRLYRRSRIDREYGRNGIDRRYRSHRRYGSNGLARQDRRRYRDSGSASTSRTLSSLW